MNVRVYVEQDMMTTFAGVTEEISEMDAKFYSQIPDDISEVSHGHDSFIRSVSVYLTSGNVIYLHSFWYACRPQDMYNDLLNCTSIGLMLKDNVTAAALDGRFPDSSEVSVSLCY